MLWCQSVLTVQSIASKIRNGLLLFVLLPTVFVGCAKPDVTDEGAARQSEYIRLYNIAPIEVSTFDGVRLKGIVIRGRKPAAKLPTVLIRTPYNIWDD